MKIADEQVDEFDEEGAEPKPNGSGPARGVCASRCRAAAGCRPERLEGVDPRTKEISKPLLAIAEAAGGEWPDAAPGCIIDLVGGEVEDPSIGVELLRDIRGVFDALEVERISSKELRAELIQLEGSPWSEWRKGSPISQRAITDRLKPYRIRKRDVRFGDSNTKGYAASSSRTPGSGISRRTVSNRRHQRHWLCRAKNSLFEPATESLPLPVEKARKPHRNADVAGVAGSEAPPGGQGC